MIDSCFETIKVVDGKALHVEYHQHRIDYTRKDFFGFTDSLNLKKTLIDLPENGEFRVRVDYQKDIQSVTCNPFTCRELKKFKIVKSDINYGYKYVNRDELNALIDDKYDDIIVLKNGLIADTTIANIALHVEGKWLTPKTPLLKGTTRERLLENGFLKCADLTLKDLENAQNFAIMNALIDFRVIKAKIELGLNSIIQK